MRGQREGGLSAITKVHHVRYLLQDGVNTVRYVLSNGVKVFMVCYPKTDPVLVRV